MYTEDEVRSATLEYFGGDNKATDVWITKYALRDNDGNLVEKTPDDMHRRIAREVARIEKKKFKKPYSEEFIYEKLKDFKTHIPQGSPMSAIGNPYQYMSLSNCFVTSIPEDSYSAILQTDEEFAQICKRRGGVGTALDNLRPNGTPTKNAARSSTGILSFLQRYSNTINEIGQNNRRGASLVSLSIHHPESVILNDDKPEEIIINPRMEHLNIKPIHTTTKYYNPNRLDFASVKLDRTKVTGANISIKLTDAFFNAVERGTDFIQQWPLNSDKPTVFKLTDARSAWDKIVTAAWLTAEPGLLFWDNIIRESIGYRYKKHGFEERSTNPCSEISLPPYDSCRLYTLNLFGFIRNPFTKESYFDYDEFYSECQIAARIMDDIVDIEVELIDRIIKKIKSDPEDKETKSRELALWLKIKDMALKGRRTGIGPTALGDTLAALNLKYGSNESIKTVDKIYKTLKFGCYEGSLQVAKEIGPFMVFDHELEKDNPFLLRIKDETLELKNKKISGAELYAGMVKYGRRNMMLLTTAPTGSVSILAKIDKYHDTTSGIEPSIFLDYIRKIKIMAGMDFSVDSVDHDGNKWHHYRVYSSGLKLWKDVTGKTKVEDSPYFKACAEDINWVERVKLQGVAQKHIDHSISSTINLPEDVTVDEVKKIYEAAWKAGLKGITVYRAGCRTGVLVEDVVDFTKRPKDLQASIYHFTSKGQPYFVLVGTHNNEPYEIFAGKNGFLDKKHTQGIIRRVKRGKYQLICNDEVILDSITDYDDANEEALTRMTSECLRHKIPIQFTVQQLEKVEGDMYCLAKSMARALKKYVPENTKVTGEECLGCGSTGLVRQEGCIKCLDCGWSKC